MYQLLPLFHLSDVTSCYKDDALFWAWCVILEGYTDFIFSCRHQVRDGVRINPRSNVDYFFFISICTTKVDREPGFSGAF